MHLSQGKYYFPIRTLIYFFFLLHYCKFVSSIMHVETRSLLLILQFQNSNEAKYEKIVKLKMNVPEILTLDTIHDYIESKLSLESIDIEILNYQHDRVINTKNVKHLYIAVKFNKNNYSQPLAILGKC